MPYFATSDNCKIYYEEHGKGKPVVLIHGWSCNHHYFKKQIPVFAEKYKVVTLDLRGHGDSERPEHGLTMPRFAQDVHELIDYLELKDVTLLGWSMGAEIIFEYVKQYGCDNLAKIVSVDMSAKIMAEADEDWPHAVFGKYDRADHTSQNHQYRIQIQAQKRNRLQCLPIIFQISKASGKNLHGNGHLLSDRFEGR